MNIQKKHFLFSEVWYLVRDQKHFGTNKTFLQLDIVLDFGAQPS